jgi:hypothetical protein
MTVLDGHGRNPSLLDRGNPMAAASCHCPFEWTDVPFADVSGKKVCRSAEPMPVTRSCATEPEIRLATAALEAR